LGRESFIRGGLVDTRRFTTPIRTVRTT
jgi:hypothetical protein